MIKLCTLLALALIAGWMEFNHPMPASEATEELKDPRIGSRVQDMAQQVYRGTNYQTSFQIDTGFIRQSQYYIRTFGIGSYSYITCEGGTGVFWNQNNESVGCLGNRDFNHEGSITVNAYYNGPDISSWSVEAGGGKLIATITPEQGYLFALESVSISNHFPERKEGVK
jgi:predicted enzyme related to lactoylglutathione lyase